MLTIQFPIITFIDLIEPLGEVLLPVPAPAPLVEGQLHSLDLPPLFPPDSPLLPPDFPPLLPPDLPKEIICCGFHKKKSQRLPPDSPLPFRLCLFSTGEIWSISERSRCLRLEDGDDLASLQFIFNRE